MTVCSRGWALSRAATLRFDRGCSEIVGVVSWAEIGNLAGRLMARKCSFPREMCGFQGLRDCLEWSVEVVEIGGLMIGQRCCQVGLGLIAAQFQTTARMLYSKVLA